MHTAWKSIALCFMVGLFTTPVTNAAPDQQKKAVERTTAVSASSQNSTAEIDSLLLELGEAISGGNTNRTISFWSDDAVFIDQAGLQTRGKAALENRFAKLFETRGKDTLALHPDKTSFPASNVAIVTGEIGRKAGPVELPATRFSMVLVKQNDRWLINEATETVIQDKHASDHLKQVEWMVGNWSVDSPDRSVRVQVNWSENKNILLSKSTAEKKDGSKTVDYQIIGFDPRKESIVSWHFSSDGGFGYGKWTRDNNEWLLDYAGVDKDGNDTAATNVFSPKSDSEFTWQSVKQTDGGNKISDSAVVTLKRSK